MDVLLDTVAVLLQAGPIADPPQVDPAIGLGSSAIGTFVSTLVVGLLLLVLAPDWTKSHMRDLERDAVGSFVYGLVAFIVSIVVVVLLAITIIGIIVAIPLAIVLYVVWVVGATIAFLAIADRFVSVEDDWVPALVIAAALNGVLTLTGIGGLVSFAVGAAGFGTLLR